MAKKKCKNWTKNLISFFQSGEPGACPFCGSDQVQAQLMRNRHGSVNFKCLSCGKFAHIDGCITTDTERTSF